MDGEDDLLKNDLLLDSFYQAQNEVLDWLRIITISAGLGCSLWWGYSDWTRLLSSYHDMRPDETEWFFGKNKTPCLDSKSSHGAKPSLLDWYDREGRERQEANSFYRCNRTNLTSKMYLTDATKDYGRIVRSVAGAFSPDEITYDSLKSPHDVVPDPSCRMGTAVELQKSASASTKYCLTMSEAAAHTPALKLQTPRLKMEHFMGVIKPEERRPFLQRSRPESSSHATPGSLGHLGHVDERQDSDGRESVFDLLHQVEAPHHDSQQKVAALHDHSQRKDAALDLLRQAPSALLHDHSQRRDAALDLLRQAPSAPLRSSTNSPPLEALRQTSGSGEASRTHAALNLLQKAEGQTYTPHTGAAPSVEAMDYDTIMEKSRLLKKRIDTILRK